MAADEEHQEVAENLVHLFDRLAALVMVFAPAAATLAVLVVVAADGRKLRRCGLRLLAQLRAAQAERPPLVERDAGPGDPDDADGDTQQERPADGRVSEDRAQLQAMDVRIEAHQAKLRRAGEGAPQG